MKANLSFAMRIYRIDQILQEKGAVSFDELQVALQCSEPTLKRDLRYLREKAGAPIVYSRARNAYMYEKSKNAGLKRSAMSMLPAAWYTPNEMYAFQTIVQQVERIENEPKAVLSADMRALKARLLALLPAELGQAKELMKRIKVILPSVPRVDAPYFALVGAALNRRCRLRLTYFTRTRSTETAREVSPLRLVNWRGRWYLDAWCHETSKLKTFSVENIRFAEMLNVQCRAVSMREVEHTLDSTYGIFSGGEQKTAVIRIDDVMTPYEAFAVWHADQKMTLHDDGSMTLEVPYANEIEIAGEIMRLGMHAKVMAPQSLADYIKQQYCAALMQYEDGKEAK